VIILPYLIKFIGGNIFMTITLARLVREARLRTDGLTQGQLGKMVGTSMENVTAIENGRNLHPSPKVTRGLSKALDIPVEYIFEAIAGNLDRFPWEDSSDLDLKDPELELMFRQVDKMLDGEPKEKVKAFIRFTLSEERRKRIKERKTQAN